ncbi:MAG: nucleoside-diphosphate-sugar epimerase [Crocinitomicaceae bacterium]|jgi:nucleoside-diphosphate-sugar epimerase
MKHLLIAGNGFVGKVTQKLFTKNGWKVTTMSRNGTGDHHADLTSLASLEALSQSISYPTHVLHCASAGGGGVESYRAVYLDGVRYLSEIFPSSHMLFTSSTSVYPQVDGELVTEESATDLERETGNILLESEQILLKAEGTVLRLAGLYGNGRSYLMRRFLAGEAAMEEDGSRRLNHTHHEDAARAILFLCEMGEVARGEIYNVCDSHPVTQMETYQALASIFSRDLPPSVPRNLQSKRGWSDKAVSNAKIRSLGWEPAYPSLIAVAEEIAASLK